MNNKSDRAHDLLSRLTRTDSPSLTPPPATTSATTWSYDVTNRLLTRPGVTYTYDNNGNTLTKTDATGTTTYGYDAENRLTSASMPGGIVAGYAYDPFGRRISKTVNGVVTRYLYDGVDILKEYDGAGAVLATYRHGPGIDEPISMTRGGQTYYYHADGLGSITGLTNSSQSLVETYGYDGFGNLTQPPTVQNPYTYTGREWDAETGLYYYRARDYDPKAGRFLQQDPIGLRGGINLYAYVGNNPIRFRDPFGLEKQSSYLDQAQECISETRQLPIGQCTGTAYGLYLGGDAGACAKQGKPDRKCLAEDYFTIQTRCREFAEQNGIPFDLPRSCTIDMFECIQNDPSLR